MNCARCMQSVNGHRYCSSCAQEIVESLRFGIPPDGCVRYLTVGREQEIKYLLDHLCADARALLIRANWGSGKTHLLRLLQEEALARGYVVSFITADANAAVRFNRMDQVFGAVCKNIQVAGTGETGVPLLLDAFVRAYQKDGSDAMPQISAHGAWDYSEYFASPALFVAIRAWLFAQKLDDGTEVRELIADWLGTPWAYRAQRRMLYEGLVARYRFHFRDIRPEWQFYSDSVFHFHTDGYRQTWDSLNDLDLLAKVCGFKGLVLLVDEFEDVIRNLRRIDWQQTAFWNLFTFFRGQKFKGQSYFAVTPDFAEKCKRLLQEKLVFDYDYRKFDQLPSCYFTPPTGGQLRSIVPKVLDIHGSAYCWASDCPRAKNTLTRICDELDRIAVADRVRITMKKMISFLDQALLAHQNSHECRS